MATPDGWGTRPLGDAGEWLSGGTPSKSDETMWKGALPWVSPKDMKRARIGDAEDHVGEDAVGNGTRLVPPDTLLMVVRGMILAHTFPVAITTRPVTFNQDIKALRPSADFDPEFLLQWLQSAEEEVLRLVDVSNHGTKRLPTERLFAAPVPLPPLPEQRKIAAILSSIDETIEKTEAVIAQLQVVKKAMMQELLTRGMPGRHTRFKQTEIGEIPEGWEIVPIGDLGTVSYGLTVNQQRREATAQAPYLTVANLQADGFILDVVKEIGVLPGDRARYECQSGDVLLVEGNANIERLGRAAVWRGEIPGAMHQNHLIRVRVDVKRIAPAWLMYWLHGRSGREQIEAQAKTSSGLNTINSTVVSEVKVALPSVDEQHRIDDAASSMDRRLRSEASAVDALRRTKTMLSSALLSGDLRVTPDSVAP